MCDGVLGEGDGCKGVRAILVKNVDDQPFLGAENVDIEDVVHAYVNAVFVVFGKRCIRIWPWDTPLNLDEGERGGLRRPCEV